MTRRQPSLHRKAGISLLALSLVSTPLLAQPPAPARNSGPALKASTPVTLNFVDADIEAVTRAIGVMMDRQFIIDPRVKGKITLYSEQPVSVHAAYLNYLAALRGAGFTVVDNAGIFKVLPEAEAKLQAGSVAVGTSGVRGDQVLTQVFRLNHESAANLVPVLRPLISPNNTINASAGNNTLVITDYADNLQRIARLIATMDTPNATDLEVVPLKYAIASDLAALVQKLADGGGTSSTPGQPAAAVAASGNSVSVLADPRSNALILRAANPARLASIRAMVEKLDQPSAETTGSGNIHVVYLKNADATKLATVLRAAFASSSNSASGSGASSGSSSGGLLSGASFGGSSGSSSGSNTTIGSSGSSSTGSSSSATSSPLSASQGPSTGGFVQADPSTNSLIITAPEPMYRQVRSVIDQLDGRRAQVYVESMIVKVDATKAAQFGIQWQGLSGNVGAGTNFGSTGNILNLSAATAQGGTTGITAAAAAGVSQGLNIGVIQKIGSYVTLGALANFLETQAGGNVLSTPNLVALDNEEARIVIGQNVPFVTGSYTSTSSTSTVNPFTTVERKDVGLTLKIRSQIGEGGTIRMTVYQENSSVVASTATATNGPTTDKSAIETSVVVDDGSILVLGGLLKDEYSDEVDGVPLLASLPLVGNLFKSQNRKRVKSNLMVFLRPVVMRNQQSADQLTLDRYESIRALQQVTQPEKNIILPDTGAPVLPSSPASPALPAAPASAASATVGSSNKP